MHDQKQHQIRHCFKSNILPDIITVKPPHGIGPMPHQVKITQCDNFTLNIVRMNEYRIYEWEMYMALLL